MTFMLFCCAQIESNALKANIIYLIISSILGDCLNFMVLMKALSKWLPRISAACISNELSPRTMKFCTPTFVMSARVNRKASFFHFYGSFGYFYSNFARAEMILTSLCRIAFTLGRNRYAVFWTQPSAAFVMI